MNKPCKFTKARKVHVRVSGIGFLTTVGDIRENVGFCARFNQRLRDVLLDMEFSGTLGTVVHWGEESLQVDVL